MAWWNPWGNNKSGEAGREPTVMARAPRPPGGFQSAATATTRVAWPSPSRNSADAEMAAAITRLRSRARDAVKNVGIALRAAKCVPEQVLGAEGIKLHLPADIFGHQGQRIEQAWQQWTEAPCSIDGYLPLPELVHLALQEWVTAGEVFIRYHDHDCERLKLQLIESERVDETYTTGGRTPGAYWRMGIETDIDTFAALSYAVLRIHPSDISGAAINRTGPGTQSWEFIDASQVCHLYSRERINQSRGYSWLSPALEQLKQLEEFNYAILERTKNAANVYGFVLSQNEFGLGPGQNVGDIVGPDGSPRTAPEEAAEVPVRASPGALLRLRPNEQPHITSIQDAYATQYDSYIRGITLGIAQALNISYATLSGDYSLANYSSVRTELLEERRRWQRLQQQLIRQFYEPTFVRWLDMAIAAGHCHLDGWYRNRQQALRLLDWQPPGYTWIDPQADIAAAEAELAAGLTSRTRLLARQGINVERHLQELAAEQELAASYGIDWGLGQFLGKGRLAEEQQDRLEPAETAAGAQEGMGESEREAGGDYSSADHSSS